MIIDRNMKTISVVVTIGNTFDNSISLPVRAKQPPSQALSRGSKTGYIHAEFSALTVAIVTNITYNSQPKLLREFIFSMVLTVKRYKALCKPAEADRQRSVLQDLSNCIIMGKPVRVHPDTFSHEKWEVTNHSRSLNFISAEKLLHRRIEHFVQQFEESKVVAFRFNSKSRQVDRCETQITSAGSDLARWVINITHYTSTATHISNFRFRMTGLVILEIKRCVNESKIRKESLGTYLHRQFEQVIIWVIRIIVDAFLDSENLNWEDGCFAMTEPCFRSK